MCHWFQFFNKIFIPLPICVTALQKQSFHLERAFVKAKIHFQTEKFLTNY